MATAPQEMKVKTLEGEMLAVEVVPTNTVKELRVMLLESKGYEDPIERQLLRVEVLIARASLERVTMPESVTSIGGWAFGECKSLKNVTIPGSLTSISSSTFFACVSLTASPSLSQ